MFRRNAPIGMLKITGDKATIPNRPNFALNETMILFLLEKTRSPVTFFRQFSNCLNLMRILLGVCLLRKVFAV